MKKYIPTEKDIEKIKELTAQKKNMNEISREMDVSWNTIYKICKEYNITNRVIYTSILEDKNLVNEIKKLYNDNVPLRKIANDLNISIKSLITIRDNLKFSERNVKGGQKPLPIPEEKLCPNDGDKKGCGIIKPISEFALTKTTRKSGNTYIKARTYCIECDLKLSSERSKKHYENNPEKYKIKNQRNKPLNNISRKRREEKEPHRKLRSSVSKAIYQALKKEDSSKNKISVFKFLPYTFQELKKYIEEQWKIPGNEWMNWNNYGSYRLGGEKKWHIDHIIPQSKLPYTSMEDENFKKCWALENLRPLEAVENIKKGNK